MTPCPEEIAARKTAVNEAFDKLWDDYLSNRFSVVRDRASVFLKILSTIPETYKDVDLLVTEADFSYMLGAALGNDRKTLEDALTCYDKVLQKLPTDANQVNVRRMRAETLLRLGRYEDAFDAMEAISVLPDMGKFEELEAAPFRMRHDAALCERLAALGRMPQDRATAAAAALRSVAKRVEATPLPGGRQRWPLVKTLSPEDQQELKEGWYGSLIHIRYPAARTEPWWNGLRPTPSSSSSSATSIKETLNPNLDWAAIEKEYRETKITVIDDFFTQETLEELWRYSQEATCFRTVRNGFLGAFPADGNTHPAILATVRSLEKSLPNVMNGHPLGLWWLFKYTQVGNSGISIHADAAAVNFNIWLTPDDARKSGGGLDVYTELPPVEAGMMEINGEFPTAEAEEEFRSKLLKAGQVRHVDYKRNRAILFVSDLYHASQPFEFPDSDNQPRVNLTLLFGDRAAERRPSSQAKAPGANEDAGAKRPREDVDWDLFG